MRISARPLSLRGSLTGQAKLKGRMIRLRSLPRLVLRLKVLPPITGVDPEPKLQGPPAVTRDWYSLRHTLKYVSHSSRVHFRSPGFRAPPQQFPFCSSPFTFCMDRISNSNWPEAPHTCRRGRAISTGESFLPDDSLPAHPEEPSTPSENNFAKLGARTQRDSRAENARMREKSDDCPGRPRAERTRPLPSLEDTFRRPGSPQPRCSLSSAGAEPGSSATEGS